MSAYKHSPLAIESARTIIKVKISRQSRLIERYNRTPLPTDIGFKNSIQDIMLEEARAAKHFWREFKRLLPFWAAFPGRQSHGEGEVNKLLDVGYHHLMTVLRQILLKYDVPTEMGLLHMPRNADSAPLIYDLVEMFRADIIDAEVLRFLRLKKKKIVRLEKEIPHFLHEVNERLNRRYYLKDFNMCHAYRYYMEVQVLKFVKAVNAGEIFAPVTLPTRHENRCLTDDKESDKVSEVAL